MGNVNLFTKNTISGRWKKSQREAEDGIYTCVFDLPPWTGYNIYDLVNGDALNAVKINNIPAVTAHRGILGRSPGKYA